MMDKFWEVAANRYLSDVRYRRQIDEKAKAGDKCALSIIATAYAVG